MTEVSKAVHEIAQGTLRGDLRDAMLQELQTGPLRAKGYGDLSETEQVAVATRVNDAAIALVRQAVELIGSEGVGYVRSQLDSYTAGPKGIRLNVSMESTPDNRLQLNDLVGRDVLLISAHDAAMRGERAPVLIKPDQPPLPLAGSPWSAPDRSYASPPDMDHIASVLREPNGPTSESWDSPPRSLTFSTSDKPVRGRKASN